MVPIPTVPTAKKPATRMTRAQAAAKAPATDGATGGGKGSSIFSRSKEGLRKASEKFKEKDQGAHHQEVKSMPSVSGSSQSIASMEALKVSPELAEVFSDLHELTRRRTCASGPVPLMARLSDRI